MVETRKACFVIVDTSRGRLVRRRPEDGSYITFQTLSPTTEDRPARLERDQPPPRVHESVGSARHGIELQLDIRTRAQAAFTKEVFGHVRGLLHDGSYESYVLIAPSRMLTLMRSMMDSELEAALIGTLAKNLTKVPDHRLLDHLRPISLKSAPRPANGLYS